MISNQFADSGSQFSDRLSAEEVDQFDNQNDHDHQFQHECAALVELVDHKTIKLFGGLDLLGDEIFVVRNADLGGCELIETRRKHVAKKFDGVVGGSVIR